MSIKPFTKVVDAEVSNQKERVEPFVDEAKGGKEVETYEAEILYKKQEGFVLKFINFLGSLKGVLIISIVFTFVVVVLDAVKTIQDLYLSNSILDGIYLFALVCLSFSLFLSAYKYYRELKKIKSVQKIKDFYIKQQKAPNKQILKPTLKLLARYMKSEDEKLKLQVKVLQASISSSQDYVQIYKDLDDKVVSIIDAKVKNKIKVASTQAAISTAISPLALLDSAIIVWRSFLLTKDIAALYGYRPGFFTTILLLKKGAFNVFFAGVAELGSEYLNSATESGLVSKVSFSAGQGVTNGILLARLGYGVMSACRPLPTKMKRASFMKGIYETIKKVIS
ncbi:MAG: DUF697 domain-containing protein [Epsilonproteobacteria bacterium]|nr:DUF697 domain-containing protein [Campylobacterota bacterium]